MFHFGGKLKGKKNFCRARDGLRDNFKDGGKNRRGMASLSRSHANTFASAMIAKGEAEASRDRVRTPQFEQSFCVRINMNRSHSRQEIVSNNTYENTHTYTHVVLCTRTIATENRTLRTPAAQPLLACVQQMCFPVKRQTDEQQGHQPAQVCPIGARSKISDECVGRRCDYCEQ